MPFGIVRKANRSHRDLHFRMPTNRIANLWQRLPNRLIQRGNLLAAHRTRTIRQPKELQRFPSDSPLRDRNRSSDSASHEESPRSKDVATNSRHDVIVPMNFVDFYSRRKRVEMGGGSIAGVAHHKLLTESNPEVR